MWVATRGGAASVFPDIIELMRRLDMDIGISVNAGLELTPFSPNKRKSRLMFDAHVGYSLLAIVACISVSF